MIPSVPPFDRSVWLVIGLFVAIAIGSVIRLLAIRHANPELAGKRLKSLRTWWLLVLLAGLSVLLGPAAICSLLAIASCVAYAEYIRLVEPGGRHRLRDACALLAIAALYVIVWLDLGYLIVTAGLAAVTAVFILFGLADSPSVPHRTEGKETTSAKIGGRTGYPSRCAIPLWGLLLVAFGPLHAAMLLHTTPTSAAISRFLYLLILTESNDIAQALVGRRFSKRSKHHVTPRISPNKSWEGLVGGIAITVCIALALAFFLELFGEAGWRYAIASGLVIGVVGFLGDINMSAVKRDAGVKDSSDALPGMGGMLDRIDSLTFTGPAFYYFVTFVLPPVTP